jgi:predicted dithiol-disulfide oxidoreductase (DUF899 family)
MTDHAFTTTTQTPPIVPSREWEAARQQLLVKEKELTRARDALAAERRRMPWLAVEKDYAFDGPEGRESLLDLFEGRRQLIAYFHMWHAGQPAAAQCEGCTFYNGQVRELSPTCIPATSPTPRSARARTHESVRYRDQGAPRTGGVPPPRAW